MDVQRRLTFILFTTVTLVSVGIATGASPWCNKSVECINGTHFHLCLGYEKGYVYRWDKPIPCLSGSFCNVSRCQEVYPQPPYIVGTQQCNQYGFTCGNRNEFRVCKYDSRNNSAPMTWDFHCPQNTFCDNTYPFFCRGTGFVPGQVQPPQAPPPGFNLPPPQNPVQQMPPSQPQAIRDECKGKGFVCADSKTYLLCRYMSDNTIRPDPEKLKCPKKHVCHKAFDKPCVSGGSSTSKFSFTWGMLATVVMVILKTSC